MQVHLHVYVSFPLWSCIKRQSVSDVQVLFRKRQLNLGKLLTPDTPVVSSAIVAEQSNSATEMTIGGLARKEYVL